MSQRDLRVRHAESGDYDAVVDFTSDIWTDRGGDYLPYVYHDWIEHDGDGQQTFVVDAGSEVAGIVQAAMLSEHEAWFQGMRVNPDYRGAGVAGMLNDATYDWAAEQGATVGRIMVFSWNVAGLGAARATGFDPGIEFRWAHPEPDVDAMDRVDTGADGIRVTSDPDVAWSHWMQSDARDVLGGLALDREESWALSELTRDTLRAAAEDTRVIAIQGDDGTTAMAFRVRDYEREDDEGDVHHYAEYGASAWDDVDAARPLYAAISEDAAELGADETRVLIAESPRHVTDTAATRAGISDEPKFVLERDLTDRR